MVDPVERTSDGRYIVVNGRRWRATDPNIPEPLRKEIVNELMDARRTVKTAKSDPEALARVRGRVSNAKIALGERGEEWWGEATIEGRAQRATAAILALLHKRGPSSSICPSEVARVIASPEWEPAMEAVRRAGQELLAHDLIRVTQAGLAVSDLTRTSGPVRFVLPLEI